MAWTQADLDALDAKIDNIRSVTFADGRKTEFQPLTEALALRDKMKAELAASASQVSRRNRLTIARVGRYR